MNHERKNRQKKKANYALQHVRRDSSVYVDEERLESFMTEVPTIQKPEQINGLVSVQKERSS